MLAFLPSIYPFFMIFQLLIFLHYYSKLWPTLQSSPEHMSMRCRIQNIGRNESQIYIIIYHFFVIRTFILHVLLQRLEGGLIIMN